MGDSSLERPESSVVVCASGSCGGRCRFRLDMGGGGRLSYVHVRLELLVKFILVKHTLLTGPKSDL
jgi:hypothetical protein